MLVAAAVHISCRNGGGGFALRIIAIVQVRSHPASRASFISFFERTGGQECTCPEPFKLYLFPTLKGDPARRTEWIESINKKPLKQGKTGSQAKMTGFVSNILWMENLP